jgi:hypothetical protein
MVVFLKEIPNNKKELKKRTQKLPDLSSIVQVKNSSSLGR